MPTISKHVKQKAAQYYLDCIDFGNYDFDRPSNQIIPELILLIQNLNKRIKSLEDKERLNYSSCNCGCQMKL